LSSFSAGILSLKAFPLLDLRSRLCSRGRVISGRRLRVSMGCGASTAKYAPARGKDAAAERSPLVKCFTRGSLIVENTTGWVLDFYDSQERVGKGGFGSVRRVTNKDTGRDRALKTLRKKRTKRKSVEEEIAVMKLLDHPHVIRIYEVFEDHLNYYLLMDFCHGGELLDFVTRQLDAGNNAETQAAIAMEQIFRGVVYMHNAHICHRDLKLENFLLLNKGDDLAQCVVKIADFGLAHRFQDGEIMTDAVGTPAYMAPQVFLGRYDKACDLWSCGVTIYLMLCGRRPFVGKSTRQTKAAVMEGAVVFRTEEWEGISAEATDMVNRLLAYDPTMRLSAEQALTHPWVHSGAAAVPQALLAGGQLKRMREFCQLNSLKQAALYIIASRLHDGEIQQLKDIFMSMDENGDGTVALSELKAGLVHLGKQGAHLEELMMGLDINGSECIDYTEFLAACLDEKHFREEGICWTAFRYFDKDGDGVISKEEIAQVLSDGGLQTVDMDAVNKVMNDVDANNDGFIDFDEFMRMMRGDSSRTRSIFSDSTRNSSKSSSGKENHSHAMVHKISANHIYQEPEVSHRVDRAAKHTSICQAEMHESWRHIDPKLASVR